jgi:hypothetical protein
VWEEGLLIDLTVIIRPLLLNESIIHRSYYRPLPTLPKLRIPPVEENIFYAKNVDRLDNLVVLLLNQCKSGTDIVYSHVYNT